MSIKQQISNLIASGDLVLVQPYVAGDPCIRKLYVERDLYIQIYRNRLGHPDEEMYANLMADLDVYVTSTTLDQNYFKCLTPKTDGIWEIRSKRPYPQIRVFGMFADKDEFVATNLKTRDELGPKTSPEWKISIRTAKAIWRRLFLGAYTNKKTQDIHALVTGVLNYDGY